MVKKIISRPKESPATKIGWWAFGLSAVTIMSGPILGISAAVLVPFLSTSVSEKVSIIIGASVAILVILIYLATLVLSIVAFRKGERSWAVLTALTLAGLETIFWIFMIVGEFLFPH